MSKKRFEISPDIARGIRNTVDSGSSNRGKLNYDFMQLDVIKPDENNPRKLSITLQEIQNGLDVNAPEIHLKKKEYENLISLADSIKKVGVRNAIEVYKDGMIYRIISGERRYLASFIAGLKSMPVRIVEKPDEFKLRYLQWIENIQREDLTLWEKHNNLKQLLSAYKDTSTAEITVTKLADILGMSTSAASRYLKLLNANNDILAAVRSGKLNNLKLVDEITKIQDSELIKSFLRDLIENPNGHSVTALKEKLADTNKTKYKKIVPASVRGRPLKTILIGKVSEISVAKKIFDILVSSPQLKSPLEKIGSIDWNSPSSVNLAFKNLITIIEDI